MKFMNTPVSGPEIVRLAIEWYNDPTYSHVTALRAALATRPECYSPPRPVAGSHVSERGPVDAVKTCPGESPPAGSDPSVTRPGVHEKLPMLHKLYVEPSLRDIAKGTTGSGDDE